MAYAENANLPPVSGIRFCGIRGSYLTRRAWNLVWELLLPVDKNTQIDRPAHKGDWIDVYVNEAGRAIVIRNVDDQVVLE